MRRHGFALLGLSIIAIAAWTYNVNYNTRTTLDRVGELRSKIAREREALQVLRVEWAYLNAPARLERLVAAHNDKLKLVPMVPELLGAVEDPPKLRPEIARPRKTGEVPIPRARPVNWRPQ